MRESKKHEKFIGIGMKKPVILKGGEIVIEDTERLVAIYPYRDADHSKVTQKTKNVLMLMCGAPKISLKILNDSSNYAREILTRYCNGIVI
jgi:DNA/RNA-binding domain of Phe-tRNA-synthetase-like protein